MIHTDLHIHSRYSSDGEFGIADLVSRCGEQQVNLFSVTDHNSVRGVGEAVALARQSGIGFIPGIEVDCCFEGTNLHVLGYHVDWQSGDFGKLEREVFAKEEASLDEAFAKLAGLGFVVDREAVMAAAGKHIPTAELIAEVMLSDEKYYSPLLLPYLEGGERSDMPYINFYLDYCAQGKPAFVAIDRMDYADAIALIRDNGGTPIIAHPGLNFNGNERVVEKLLDKGAAGLEVFNNYHRAEQIDYFVSVARQRNCILTCGSDFHGKTKPLIEVGRFRFDSRYTDILTDSIRKIGGA